MTEQHPITPPPELVEKWHSGSPFDRSLTVATKAAQWGADQELEACCEWLDDGCEVLSIELRRARRPKPLSLKRRAMSEVAGAMAGGNITPERGAIIRIALEMLPDD